MSLIASYQTVLSELREYTKTNSQLPFIYLTLTIARLLNLNAQQNTSASGEACGEASGHRIVGH